MADGKTHSRMTLLHGSYFSVVLYLLGFYSIPAFFAGFFYQIFASPDMDVDDGNISLYYLRKYTFFLQYYWRGIWFPYALVMKHRGKSHAIYGTIVRLIFVLCPFIILLPQLRDDYQVKLTSLSYFCAIAQILSTPIILLVYLFVSKFGIGSFCVFVTAIWLGDLIHLAFDSYYYKP